MARSRTITGANPELASARKTITVLIVFLILFVLLAIGGWVFGFTVVDSDANKDQKLAQEQSKVAAIEAERDWYRYCALTFLNYTGELKGEEEIKEFNTLNDKFVLKRNVGGANPDVPANQLFAAGNLPDSKMPELKVLPKATVLKILNDLDPICSYTDQGGTLKISRNMAQAIQAEKDTWKDVAAADRASLQARKTSDRQADKAVTDSASQKTNYEKNLKILNDSVTAELKKYQDQFKQVKAEMDAQTATFNQQQAEVKKQLAALAEANGKLTQANADLAKQVKDRDDKLTQNNEERLSNETARKVPTDIRMIQVADSGTEGHINVGSADHVTPQLSFSVFGVTPDGRVDNTNKATIEVVNVVGEHLSQVRVTGQRVLRLDRTIAVIPPTEILSGRDKVLQSVTKNDVVYNAAWHPSIQRHVAVAGIVDLNGDNKNAMPDFLRLLEKQNLVVDAYIDLHDFEIRGKVTVNTDYLIIGGGAEMLAEGINPKVGEKLNAKMDELREQARKNGVEKMNVKRFIDVIGYRLPSSASGSLSSNYRFYLDPGAPAPGGDVPAKKEEKKPDPNQ